MLTAMRRMAGTWYAKILFVLLVASFAIWGIEDVVRNFGRETAVVRIGDSAIMLATPCSESGLGGPDALQGTSVGLHLYVNDVDSQFARALQSLD